MSGLNRDQALNRAFEFKHKSGIEGDYYEFGVYQGNSLIRATKSDVRWVERLGSPQTSFFFGFDSFEGLPPPEKSDRLEGYSVFEQGQYAASEREARNNIKENGARPERVVLIPGFYKVSLKAPETHELLGSSVAAIIHIDCDYCSSAGECLSFMADRLQDGSLLMFDDWFCYRGNPHNGVQRAFREWQDHAVIQAVEYFRYSWAGICFILSSDPSIVGDMAGTTQ